MLYHLITDKPSTEFIIWTTNDDCSAGIYLSVWSHNVLDCVNTALELDANPSFTSWIEDGDYYIILTQSEPFTPDILQLHPELFI